MEGKCNSENVVYQANIFLIEKNKDEIYIGISAGNWKQRFYNNRYSCINPLLRKQTALSRWFGSLKESKQTPQIKWKFI